MNPHARPDWNTFPDALIKWLVSESVPRPSCTMAAQRPMNRNCAVCDDRCNNGEAGEDLPLPDPKSSSQRVATISAAAAAQRIG